MKHQFTLPRTLLIRKLTILFVVLVICLGCKESQPAKQRLRLATTTSTRDSGLLDRLLPPFQTQHDVRVDVIAAGTGKALKLGERGDVDVLFVHAREAENAFMQAGHGIRREDVMHNTFELLGPRDDPAEVRDLEITAALKQIASQQVVFISRGDDSGTHKRELQLWNAAAIEPNWQNYLESGQGMGATLTIADEKSAYVLTDRGTYLNFRGKIDLVPLVAQSDELRNPYGIIVVNPDKSSAVRDQLANQFVDYIISPEAQRIIRDYRLADEQLFFPVRLP